MNAAPSPRVDMSARTEEQFVALRAAESLKPKSGDSKSSHPEETQSRKHKAQDLWRHTLFNERQKRNQDGTTEPCGIKLKTAAAIICPSGFHFGMTLTMPRNMALE